jgi:hypothetical protein
MPRDVPIRTPIVTPRTAAMMKPTTIPNSVVCSASQSWPLVTTSPKAATTEVGGARKKSPSRTPAYCQAASTPARIVSWANRSRESRLRRSMVARDSCRRSTAIAI